MDFIGYDVFNSTKNGFVLVFSSLTLNYLLIDYRVKYILL